MSKGSRWAIRLPPKETLSSGALRLRGGIDVLLSEHGDVLWLRGRDLTEDLTCELRKLATDGLFVVTPDGTFFRRDSHLPVGQLPAAGWQPFDQWLAPAPQPAAGLARLDVCLGLQLERCSAERAPGVLVTRLDAWATYAGTAPSIRLSVLQMAASADGRVVVRGDPLPSIQGTRYAEAFGIAVPCGWKIQPEVDPPVIATLLGLSAGDFALFRTDGSYEHVPAQGFIRVTRASTRETLVERGHE